MLDNKSNKLLRNVKLTVPMEALKNLEAQHAESVFNRIEDTFTGTFLGRKSMHQGFGIYII